jgi:hypothetical protein
MEEPDNNFVYGLLVVKPYTLVDYHSNSDFDYEDAEFKLMELDGHYHHEVKTGS